MKEAEAFVNVGVWHGFTLLSGAGMANNGHKRCIGVDTFSQFGGGREGFILYRVTSTAGLLPGDHD